MTKTSKSLDLTKTAAALEAFDKFTIEHDERWENVATTADVDALLAEYRREEMKVAEAFADDTADLNSRETVLACVRPGPRVVSDHMEESFVRRMVRRWKEQ